MHSSLFKFTLALNSVLLFLKMLVFEFLLGISGIFLCSTSLSSSKNCPSARYASVLMLFVGTLTYLGQKLFLLIVFYSSTFLIIKILTVININVCIYVFFPRRIMVGVTALTEVLFV
jgi:cytochrome b subunit of formate dehydrogenase